MSRHDWNLTQNTSIRRLSEDSVLWPSSFSSSWGDGSVILHPGAKLQECHHHDRDCTVANRFGFWRACRLPLSQDCSQHGGDLLCRSEHVSVAAFLEGFSFPRFCSSSHSCLEVLFLVRSLRSLLSGYSLRALHLPHPSVASGGTIALYSKAPERR